MELRHLDTLLAIAEEGSFTAAADALATVQSNVSDQVRQLEAELGVPLLVRSRKGAEPTEFGVLVLDPPRLGQSPGHTWTATQLELTAPAPVHAGIDGEAVDLTPPLRFAVRPRALRVRLPRP